MEGESRVQSNTPGIAIETSRPVDAYLSLALAMAIVGSSVVTGKYITDGMPIFLALLLRFAGAVVVMVAWLGPAGRIRAHLILSRRDHTVIAIQALAGSVAFNVLLLYGLRETTAAASGVITSATPVMIAIISFLLGERLRGRVWAGVLLTMAGVATVNVFGVDGGTDHAANAVLGAILVLGAVVGESLYTILAKMVSPGVSPTTMALWSIIYSTMMFLPLGLWQMRGFDPSAVPTSAWLSVAYSAVIVTVAAFVLWFRGLKQVPATTAAPFTGVIPIVAVILAAILLGEPIGWPHLVGIVCVIGGILLITRTPSSQEIA
ncbi:MAG TPA: DMT family transporter [Thermomicrobiales bacterium]|nr:DMT family transporter [Thermomicrobiales bacterium]